MADVKISGMAAATALTGAEVLPVVQSSANVKATTQQVVDAAMTTGLTRQALGSINTNTTIDWSAGSYVTATIGGALTFTFSNPAPTGKACVAYLQLTNGGSAAITWPVSVTWSGGTAPTLRTSGVDLLRFYTQDNGTTWFGTAENDESNVAGSDTQVLFNDAGSLAGDSGFTFNKTNNTIDLGGGTVTASDPVVDASQTWNGAGVAFTGLRFNATDIASSVLSNLLDVQLGGSSVFRVRKTYIQFSTAILLSSNPTVLYSVGGGALWGTANNSGFSLPPSGPLQWSSVSGDPSGSGDLQLVRDAANTLAQQRGTNAQTFRVYRSYTDGSNYSRWTVKWNTSTAILHAEGAGTGSDGSVAFNDAALATNATVGFLMIPSCAGTPSGTPADIPTGQAPIVYNSTDKKLAVWDGAAWVQTAALT